jgi:hypothetical protein
LGEAPFARPHETSRSRRTSFASAIAAGAIIRAQPYGLRLSEAATGKKRTRPAAHRRPSAIVALIGTAIARSPLGHEERFPPRRLSGVAVSKAVSGC